MLTFLLCYVITTLPGTREQTAIRSLLRSRLQNKTAGAHFRSDEDMSTDFPDAVY